MKILKILKQTIGFGGLVVFIGYMIYKFKSDMTYLKDSWLVISLMIVFVILILLAIERILRDD